MNHQETKGQTLRTTSDGRGVDSSRRNKRQRALSLGDRILKFKRGLDELTPLVADESDLSQEIGRLRDRCLDRYVEIERRRGEDGTSKM